MLIDHSFGCRDGSPGVCCKTVDRARIRHRSSSFLSGGADAEAQAQIDRLGNDRTAVEQAARSLKAKRKS
ncbi:hypothetical protein AB0V79_02570 [Mesorhizobium ciceri]|uniref:hypothetical protein n=1 Tax=Mesorhizobium ciceri TaxID=39645 RepID=UPI000A502D66|nr:hypothetical protein [Mesorhizobium ciceri]